MGHPLEFVSFAQRMTGEMQKHIIDKELQEWLMPDFTTTTTNGKVIASAVLMGAMSKYFDYSGRTGCGLP